MKFQIPVQDQRYADTGKRRITIGGREVNASLSELKPSEAHAYTATHQIYLDRVPGIAPGMIVVFEDMRFIVTKIIDPRAADPTMRGRYLRLICNRAPAE